MLGKLKLRRVRKELRQVLSGDITQKADWEAWLSDARSMQELRRTCPDPGWFTYLAYFEEVKQDALYQGALALGNLAASGDPNAPVTAAMMGKLDSLDFTDLSEMIIDLERRHELIDALIDVLPTQTCYAMMALYSRRLHLREMREIRTGEEVELSPFRSDPAAIMRQESEGALAAGYVLTLETPMLRHEGLRDALAVRAAAAAALLRGSFADFPAQALRTLKESYGWS